MIDHHLIADLLIILVSSWVLGSFFARFGLPQILGPILAGVIFGTPILGLVHPSPSIELLAELGIFVVMFHTGMEMDPNELLEHIWPSLAVAAGGFVLPFVLGYAATRLYGGTVFQSLFVGMCISITAIAVQTVILKSMQIHKTYLGHIIIGAAIADDIMSLVGLSILLGWARTGSLQVLDLSIVILKVVGFFGVTIIMGQFVLPRFTRRLHDREGKAFTFAMVAAFIMALLAELAGLHFIIGAFLAGQFVSKEIMEEKLFHAISDRFFGLSYGFLIPVFLFSLSFHIRVPLSGDFFMYTSLIIILAIIGKLIGCGLGLMPFRRNFWESAIVGFGMNGRGAVELVVVSVVSTLSVELMKTNTITVPLITELQFSSLVLMAFVTTMMAPITLKWSVGKACSSDEKVAFCTLWDEQQ